MQNFLLVENEILKSQIGSIKLTNKRIIQSRGEGKTFSVSSIPVDKVSGSITNSSINNNWLALSGLSAIGILVLYTQRFDEIYFLVPLFVGLYGVWKYFKSRRSVLRIYSVGAAVIAEDVSTYNKSALINFSNSLDNEIIKSIVGVPTGNTV